MALTISSLVDVAVGELLPVVAVGELLPVLAAGEVLLGESWLFIFVAHKLKFCWVLFFFAFLCVLCGKAFALDQRSSAKSAANGFLIRVHSR
jgi:hypothetical protein